MSAVQILIEQVMREELEQCIGASWGECTPMRRGYRNGFYTRDLVTPTGRIEDLKVPRDRAGQRTFACSTVDGSNNAAIRLPVI